MKRVKRSGYKQLYTSRRRRRGSSVIRAIVGVVIMAAIIFVGYSILPIIKQLTSGKWKPPVKTTSSAVNSSSLPSSSPSSGSSSGTSSASVVSAKIRGCFLPKSYLSDITALKSFIAQAKDAGINLAVVDLKGEDGVVNYDTNVSAAKGTQLVSQNAPDAKQAAALLAQAGITPAAHICAFKDPLAPQVIRGAGVMYAGNHAVNWLDPTNTRWLNPFSPLAQNYISGLCTEAVTLGYKQIFIDSLTFPTYGTETQSYYGENMPSKEKVLTDYV